MLNLNPLFYLKSLDARPIELTTKDGYLGDTVAISNEFAVVGNSGTMRLNHDYLYHSKTLIKSLKNDSNIITDIQGKLSLDENLLAVMLSSSRSYFRSVASLKLFRFSTRYPCLQNDRSLLASIPAINLSADRSMTDSTLSNPASPP